MQTFFALLPGPDIQRRIADWRDRALPPLEHPVHAANLHITLAFLGKTEPWHFEPLIIQGTELGFTPLELHLDEMGYWAKAGVAWLGPSRPPDGLAPLARKLSAVAGALGLAQDKRRYQPHLTFARKLQQPPPAPTITPDFAMRFDEFVLMQSRPSRTSVRYEVVERFA